MKTNLLLLALPFLVMACTSSSSSSSKDGGNGSFSVHHVFEATKCFKNKAASAGMGQAIYTLATIAFNDDGTGTTEFSLYSDATCSTLLGQGTANHTYQITRVVDGVNVVQVNQEEPSAPGGVNTFYLALFPKAEGAEFHIDGDRVDAGPYSAAPTDADLLAFAADPDGVGIFFRHK